MIGGRWGRAYLKAETLGSRLHVSRRLAKKWKRFELESKWPKYHFSKGMPRWVPKSTSIFVERSEDDDCSSKRELWTWGFAKMLPGDDPFVQ